MAGGANPVKAVLYALGANFAIAVTKYIAAFITNSGSMLAEAVHSTADCGNQLLLLLGMKRAKRPPSPDYPLGFGKETYFWSFIVALMLFSVGGLFSVYEGWHKLHEPEAIKFPLLALGVLGFGIVAESFSTWGCLTEVNKLRGNQTLWQWFRSSRNSELIVILGEDLAALFGLTLAFIAVSITWATGDPIWDALGSIAIGVLLIVVAILVGIEVKALLVGQGVEDTTRAEMVKFLEDQPAVEKVLNLLSLQMGPDAMIAVKARMRPTGTDVALVEGINKTEVAFREAFPQVAFLFFEPDLKD
ncbi:cation diffusion facilitator family transporter [Usitatibacter palustris]|uniref:Ferrous-iron efflux pump FieF n=1 Tax=Usitatibacter palustris TaxID=2732487 RepID=A0A6M4H734_9PROT|nr:cation diffusion facilitator family transporter [Usitatibacter palustris]QJR14995.1 Ferrous-iron efflux pump FieF [Usitatibacter palustris]